MSGVKPDLNVCFPPSPTFGSGRVAQFAQERPLAAPGGHFLPVRVDPKFFQKRTSPPIDSQQTTAKRNIGSIQSFKGTKNPLRSHAVGQFKSD